MKVSAIMLGSFYFIVCRNSRGVTSVEACTWQALQTSNHMLKEQPLSQLR